jgi:hypothetical protein
MTECPICHKECESKYRIECDNSCGTVTSQPCGCEYYHNTIGLRVPVKGHNPQCGDSDE